MSWIKFLKYEDVGDEEMRRRFLLWQFRMLTAARSGELDRLQRIQDEIYREWAAADRVTELLEKGKISNDDALTLLELLLERNADAAWALLEKKEVTEDETA